MRNLILIVVAVVCWSGESISLAATTRPAALVAEVDAFLNEADFGKCHRAMAGWDKLEGTAKLALLTELATRLDSTVETPLVNLADTFIVPRPKANPPAGHGWMVRHDIFLHGGKAAAVIDLLLDASLPPVTGTMTNDQRDQVRVVVVNAIAAYKRGLEDARGTQGAGKIEPN